MLRIDRETMAYKGQHSWGGHMTKTIDMAVLRFHRKRVLLVFLIACLFWLMYMLSFLPSKNTMDEMVLPQPGALMRDYQVLESILCSGKDLARPVGVQDVDRSISRKYFTTTVDHDGSHPKIEQQNNVIAVPQLSADSGILKEHLNTSRNGNKSEEVKDSHPDDNHVDVLAISNPIKNKTYELGVKIKNNTVEIRQKMKNKTLEQLAVMGVAVSKTYPQLISVPQKWNLSVSFDDIGEIMNETQFLNKVDPLNLNGPILLSTRNRTANFTYSMPLKFGFCDCFEHYCVCCSKIMNRKLHLNSTACSNFTFVSKTHELDLQFSLDGKPVHRSKISADKSPLLCLGSNPKVADICVHFFNMTFKVNEHNAHQTQLLGCTDLSLNLYHRTIGAFPVDCFQIPGDPNQVHRDRKFNMMFNWVP